MTCSHTGGWHSYGRSCHIGHRTVGQPVRQPIRHVIMVGWWWRFVIQHSKFVFLGLEVIVAISTDFAIRAGFMSAAVSGNIISLRSK